MHRRTLLTVLVAAAFALPGAALAQPKVVDYPGLGIEPGTVVFCIADAMAVGAMNEINAAGREVGPDIALAGFDDIPTARDVTPALTTVHVPLRNAGYQALRAAVDEEWEQDSSSLAVRVVLRDSTPPLG